MKGAFVFTALALIVLLCISPLALPSVFAKGTGGLNFTTSRINLSNGSGNAVEPYVAAGGSNVYVAWDNNNSGTYRLFFRASNNSGLSFKPIYVVSCPAIDQTCNTKISKSGNIQILAEGNHVVLVWKEGDSIYESASSDAGATWTNPVSISSSVTGIASSPVDAIYGSYVYVAWVLTPPSSNPEVYVTNSSDFGQTMNPTPLLLSTGASDTANTSEDSVAASGTCVYATWDSVWFTASCSNGTTGTWSSPVQIRNKCCFSLTDFHAAREPIVTANGTNVYVTWTGDITGKYEAYVMVSGNNGQSFTDGTFKSINLTTNFSTARELQPSAWGNLVAVTYFGQNTTEPVNQWVSVSTNGGNSFSTPHQTLSLKHGQPGFGGVLVYGTNIYIFWPHGAKGGIAQMYFVASENSGTSWIGSRPSPISSGPSVGMMSNCKNVCDNGPMLAASGSHVYLVWEQILPGNVTATMFSAT